MAGFLSWIASEVGEAPGKFSVRVGPRTRVDLLLTGATRPEGSPEYITVEDFLKAQQAPAPAK